MLSLTFLSFLRISAPRSSKFTEKGAIFLMSSIVALSYLSLLNPRISKTEMKPSLFIPSARR
jgi:hypothetical protein